MKATHLFLGVLGVIIVLAGCNSFNSYQIPESNYREVVAKKLKDEQKYFESFPSEAVSAPPPTTPMCPVYKPPVLPKVPEIPWKQLQAVSRDDVRAIDTIQQQHIDDLRQYITSVLRLLSEAQDRYLKSCGGIKPTPNQ